MLDLGKLKLSIEVDTKEPKDSLKGFKQEVEDTKSKSIANFKNIAKGIAAAGITTAIVGTGKKLYGMAEDAAETADRIDKLSAKTGLSKKSFQEWDYVMGQNGASIESMQTGMKTLTSLMDSAAEGNATAQESFNSLNLTWKDGNGNLKTQEQMMEEALYALADMENGTEKAKLATELFGKAGTELLPMLNNGSASMDDLRGRAHELGLVMSDDAVSAGVVLGDTMADVKASLGAVATQIGVAVMPIIQALLELILKAIPYIKLVVGTVIEAIKAIAGFGIEMYNAGVSLFTNLWDGIKNVWNSIVNWVQEKVDWLADKLAFWNKGKNKMDGSHRTGLNYVPFDGYRAVLHKGEMVLTSNEAREYKNGTNNKEQNNTTVIVNNYSPKALNEVESARQFKKATRQLALS